MNADKDAELARILGNRKAGGRLLDQGAGATPSKAALQAHLVKLFKVNDAHCVVLFGFRTAFGGGKSTGFALVYNTLDDALDIEPKYRLQRADLMAKSTGSRKQRREMKNKRLKVRGIAKAKIGGGKKR